MVVVGQRVAKTDINSNLTLNDFILRYQASVSGNFNDGLMETEIRLGNTPATSQRAILFKIESQRSILLRFSSSSVEAASWAARRSKLDRNV
jgi:hypothetical protein